MEGTEIYADQIAMLGRQAKELQKLVEESRRMCAIPQNGDDELDHLVAQYFLERTKTLSLLATGTVAAQKTIKTHCVCIQHTASFGWQ